MSGKRKKMTRAERKLREVEMDKEHKPKPATNAERCWYERVLHQMRLPGFEDKSNAA